jgi:hypothetical protein
MGAFHRQWGISTECGVQKQPKTKKNYKIIKQKRMARWLADHAVVMA